MQTAAAKSQPAGGVLPHNLKAAATWGSGGRDYDAISTTIADAIEHVVDRVSPQIGEKFLDVATGTGWTARRIAARGASVIGIDIGQGVVEAAKKLAPEIEFRVGDAEAIEFADESFDCVVSTFGVMFVSRPEEAARELARVCKRGGRLGLVTWPPGDTVEDLFKVMRPYMPPPAASPAPSPFAWGTPERVEQLLSAFFDLKFETGTTTLRMPSGKAVWDLFVTSYGPTKSLAGNCGPEHRQHLERDFIAYHERFSNSLGIAVPRKYLVTVGTRK